MAELTNLNQGAHDQMHKFQCHKVVRAAVFMEILKNQNQRDVCLRLNLDCVLPDSIESAPRAVRYAIVMVDQIWVEKNNPQVGGIYVVYGDGYSSYSPSAAFANGYTALPKENY